MLQKIRNKPLWFKIWAITVAASAVYFLVKSCFFEVNSTDRLVETYALVSLLVDYLISPGDKK